MNLSNVPREERLKGRALRMIRRSGGLLKLREARELVARISYSDPVGARRPSDFSSHFAELKGISRPAVRERAMASFASYCRDKFWHYGPSGGAGMWPGDRMVWDAEVEFCPGRKGGWVVARGNG